MKISSRTDLATLGGLAIAVFGIALGVHLEGIQIQDIGQLTAALVVFCGTAGAVLISIPAAQARYAISLLPELLRPEGDTRAALIDTLVDLARTARVRGILALEERAELVENPFLRKALRLAVDSVGSDTLLAMLEAEMHGMRSEAEGAAVFYETAAGYAPTLGMAGAAIGLLQVMKHLDNIAQVGSGVAAAFVATIYGVLLSNLILLPVATRICARMENKLRDCALIREAVVAMTNGLNPTLTRLKLESLAQIEDQPAPAITAGRILTAASR